MNHTPVALITGATRGIGLRIAQDLTSHGFTVLVGSRDLSQGQNAAARIDGDAWAVQLDVTDQASIDAAAARVRAEFGRLDVLVNNAGIMNAGRPGETLDEQLRASRLGSVSLDEIRAVFETNVFGVVAVTQALLPLLRIAPSPRVVNLASSGGSLTLASDPGDPRRARFGAYSVSKVALNGLTVGFAADLESAGIKVNSADPGLTATDLNDFLGMRTVEEAAREPVRLALLDADGPTGTFSNDAGPLPW